MSFFVLILCFADLSSVGLDGDDGGLMSRTILVFYVFVSCFAVGRCDVALGLARADCLSTTFSKDQVILMSYTDSLD